jgi:hypothetical protein
MFSNTKREILCGVQYVLIGIIAECSVLIWFDTRPVQHKLLAWLLVAISLSAARFVALGLSYAYRRNQWGTISKRNWD